MKFTLYRIRFCRKDELLKLKTFIDKYWKHNHVLCLSDELFCFQHDSGKGDRYDFVVAENVETGMFDGVYGFISSRKYDETQTIPEVIWGAVWKVRDDVFNKEIGKIAFALFQYMLEQYPQASWAVLGMSEAHRNIAKALHLECGVMNHYYMVNPDMADFRIAINPELPDSCVTADPCIHIKPVCPDDAKITYNPLNPNKNIPYLKGRYMKHPHYNYMFWGVYREDRVLCVFVVRKIDVSGRSVLRIIDAVGDLEGTGSLHNEIRRMLSYHCAEYIDCLNWGIDEALFRQAGFAKTTADDGVVIPSYFEPFESKKVFLDFAYLSDYPLVLFKGDGDQDRPNLI